MWDNRCESVGTWIMDVGVWECRRMGVGVWECERTGVGVWESG
jgi:hypothetical protein